jgi:hypothetical protein
MTITSGERVRLAALALKGLSVGDAFGELFFGAEEKVLQAVEDLDKSVFRNTKSKD